MFFTTDAAKNGNVRVIEWIYIKEDEVDPSASDSRKGEDDEVNEL